MNDGDRFAAQELRVPASKAHVEGPAAGGKRQPASRGEFLVFDEGAQREFENSASPMRIFDIETLRYLVVNAAAVQFYGYTREEFLELTVSDTRHPEERAELADKEQAGYLRHRPARRHVKKSGEVVVIERVTQDVLYKGRRARLSLTIDITDRVRMQEMLWQRQEEFERLAENLPDLVARFDRSHRFVYLNSAVEKLLGRSRHEMIGRTQRELGMPDDLAATFERSLDEAIDAGKSHTLEFTMAVTGGERLFEAYHIPERNPDGQIATVLCVARDITERKKGEDALRESNEFLHSVIESSRDCIKVLDLDGRLLSISAGGQRLMEVDDASVFLGKPYLDFWSGQDRVAAEKVLRISRGGDMGRFEGYCPTAKGSPKWWDEIVTPILDKHGRPQKLLVVSRDITDYKNAENALRESEARFRQLAENIRQVFWINTLRGDRIIYVSPAYEEIWGKSRESLYRNPRSWMESIHRDDLPAVQDCQKRMARGERTDIEYRIVRPDGSVRWIKDRSYLMKAGDNSPLACGIAEDITEIKAAEQERLTHAMHQRDALVREVHHRIKNSLQGVVWLLRQKVKKHPAVAPDIEEAVGQLQSLALVYGLQETRPDGRLSLADITDAICSSAEKLIGGRVKRTYVRKSREQACIEGAEAVSVAVALNELVFNALKHQPKQAGGKRATLKLSEARGTAEISITNRGRLPRSFDFEKGRAVGYGLGLVRTLLAPPGGKIGFNGGRDKVEVKLTLAPPLLAEQRKAK
jgi:PAS domain S-box-containing protein